MEYQDEALKEIVQLEKLDSSFIVGYFDTFYDNDQMNIITEFCHHGNLCDYIRKQQGKPFIENFIWKVFIHICLGVYYLH